MTAASHPYPPNAAPIEPFTDTRLYAWTLPAYAHTLPGRQPNYQLVLLDFNGTLAETVSGKEFAESPSDWRWMAGRSDTCALMRAAGVRLAIATNQGSVGFANYGQRGMTANGLLAELNRAALELGVEGFACCFAHPKATDLAYRCGPDYPYRKPQGGMLSLLAGAMAVQRQRVLFIGDRSDDMEAAIAAGVDFIWADEFFTPAHKAELPSWLTTALPLPTA